MNIERRAPMADWVRFWKSKGAGDVLWAQDTTGSAVSAYQLLVVGTEVIVDRNGGIAFRSDGPAGLKRLRSEIEKSL